MKTVDTRLSKTRTNSIEYWLNVEGHKGWFTLGDMQKFTECPLASAQALKKRISYVGIDYTDLWDAVSSPLRTGGVDKKLVEQSIIDTSLQEQIDFNKLWLIH